MYFLKLLLRWIFDLFPRVTSVLGESSPEGFQLTLPRSLEDSHLWQLQPYEMLVSKTIGQRVKITP